MNKKTLRSRLAVLAIAIGIAPVAFSANLVVPAAAYAENSYGGREPVYAINGAGLTGEAHGNSAPNTMWMGLNSGSFAKWFVTDLGSVVPLHSMKIWNYNQQSWTGRGVKVIDIYISTTDSPSLSPPNFADTATWTLLKAGHTVAIASGTTAYTGDAVLYLPVTIDARWVGFDIKSIHSSSAGYGGISEIQFFSSTSPGVQLDALSDATATGIGVAGTLLKDNGLATHVLACAGAVDGGVSPDDWDVVVDFGVKSVGAFQEAITGLTADRGYILALCATNGVDVPGWSVTKETFITSVVSVDAPGDVYESSPLPGSIIFSRPVATTNVALTVNYTLRGTAVAGVDFETMSGSFTFPADEETYALSFKTIDNALTDGNRTVTVSVSADTCLTNATSTVSFTILDDETLAKTVTWTGAGGDLNWTNAANWDLGVPLPIDTAIFTDSGLSAGDVVALGANQTIRKLTIATATAFTIGHVDDVAAGYALALTDLERQDVAGTEGRHTFGAPVNLVPDGAGNSTWTIDGSDLVRMNAVLGSLAPTTFVKMGTGNFNMYFRSPTYAGPWQIVEGTVTASYSSDISYSLTGTMKGDATIGGTAAPALLAQSLNAIYGNMAVTVLTNGAFTVTGATSGRVKSVHVKEGGTATVNSSFFYCYFASLTGGTINGPNSGRFYNGGYGQKIQSYSSPLTAVFNCEMNLAEYYEAYVIAEDGPPAIDLDMTTGSIYGKAQSLRKQGTGTVVFGKSSSHYHQAGTNSTGFVIEAGRAIFNNATGSGSGKNKLQVNGGATIGGTGFLGGDSAHANYGILVQGGSTSSRAAVEPGSVDPATGASLTGTLTVGSATAPNAVTFGAHSRLNLQIGAEGASDKLDVYGTVDLSSTSDGLALTVDPEADAGTYVLVSASGGISGEFNTIDTAKPGLLTQTATTIEYTVPPSATLIIVR